MKVGITGTREGMNLKQRQELAAFLSSHPVEELHHGDCYGVDEEAHVIYRGIFGKKGRIIVHPPKVSTYRASMDGDEFRPPKDYWQRNQDIVNEVDLLIAIPFNDIEQLRSGTWATVRYARKVKRNIRILDRI